MAKDIDEVLEGLADVVEKSRRGGERVGYFAALYRHVTLEIAKAVAEQRFDDNPRMDRFDAEFGTRYFTALQAWQEGRGRDAYPRTWRDTFDLTRSNDLAVVQHLLLGINAHINVDLAVAAAKTSPGTSIYQLKRDFDAVNDILTSVLDRIQRVLNEFSPAMRLLDLLGGRLDEELMSFSVRKARANAWDAAVVLANVPGDVERHTVRLLDTQARKLGRLVAANGGPLSLGLLSGVQTRSVSEVVERLNAPLPAR